MSNAEALPPPTSSPEEASILSLVEEIGPDGSFFSSTTPEERAMNLAEGCHRILNDKSLSRSARITHIVRETVHCYADTLEAEPQIDDREIRSLASIAEALFSRAKTDTELASEISITEEGLQPLETLSPIQLARTLAEGFSLFDEFKIALLATQLWVLERAIDPDSRDQLMPTHLIAVINELKYRPAGKRPIHGFNSPVY